MDAKQVWRAALGELQVSLSPANYETWLRDTQLYANAAYMGMSIFDLPNWQSERETPFWKAIVDWVREE